MKETERYVIRELFGREHNTGLLQSSCTMIILRFNLRNNVLEENIILLFLRLSPAAVLNLGDNNGICFKMRPRSNLAL